uniref:Uncharacterized protein n=1 Tax=Micrurus spixii TaxID=129469 RepID=A0A2D4LFM0_9SAUR
MVHACNNWFQVAHIQTETFMFYPGRDQNSCFMPDKNQTVIFPDNKGYFEARRNNSKKKPKKPTATTVPQGKMEGNLQIAESKPVEKMCQKSCTHCKQVSSHAVEVHLSMLSMD